MDVKHLKLLYQTTSVEKLSLLDEAPSSFLVLVPSWAEEQKPNWKRCADKTTECFVGKVEEIDKKITEIRLRRTPSGEEFRTAIISPKKNLGIRFGDNVVLWVLAHRPVFPPERKHLLISPKAVCISERAIKYQLSILSDPISPTLLKMIEELRESMK